MLDDQYITNGIFLVGRSHVASDDKARLFLKCYHNGVQAYPCEKGTVTGRLALRTGIDFEEDLKRYPRVCKSSGDRSVGVAWELFQPMKEENTTSVQARQRPKRTRGRCNAARLQAEMGLNRAIFKHCEKDLRSNRNKKAIAIPPVTRLFEN